MITWSLTDGWDLELDALFNIKTKSDNDQIAQDVASSLRVFKGELALDGERGIEYNKPEQIRNSLRFDMERQAKLIDGVRNVHCVFDNLQNRELKTTVYIETEDGDNIEVV